MFGAVVSQGRDYREVFGCWGRRALILHTGLYHGLCVQLGGGFIHHVPKRPDPANRSQGSIEAAGYTVDRALWRGPRRDRSPVRGPRRAGATGAGRHPSVNVCTRVRGAGARRGLTLPSSPGRAPFRPGLLAYEVREGMPIASAGR